MRVDAERGLVVGVEHYNALLGQCDGRGDATCVTGVLRRMRVQY
jgi:hypothetical protein